MSLFKDNLIVSEIPEKFLAAGEKVRVRIQRLNTIKMSKANQANTFKLLDNAEAIRGHLSKEALAIQERHAESQAVAKAKAEGIQPKSKKPEVVKDTFTDFDNLKLVELARPEFSFKAGPWVSLDKEDPLEDLPFLDWLAGEIYDESRSYDEEEREKNS